MELPLGGVPVGDRFQRKIDDIFKGFPYIFGIINDILVICKENTTQTIIQYWTEHHRYAEKKAKGLTKAYFISGTLGKLYQGMEYSLIQMK